MNLKSRNKWEYRSYLIIIASAVLLFIGILLGSFIQGTIYLASLGALGSMIGICLYIVSQIIESKEEVE